MKRIYISGPISHHDQVERGIAFYLAEKYILDKGFVPVNPLANGLPFDTHWSKHMRVDLGLLLSCDAVYVLKGWELSKGCKLEIDVATTIGLPVFFENFFNYKLTDFSFGA